MAYLKMPKDLIMATGRKLVRTLLFFFRLLYIFYLYPTYVFCIKIWVVDDVITHYDEHSAWFAGVQYQKLPGSVPINSDQTMLLSAHRNIADFFIHDRVAEHTCCYLSRALVGFAFPLIGLVGHFGNGIWFFVRGNSGNSIEQFFKWIDFKLKTAVKRRNLIVYPEGHRNLKPHPLKLRTGMICYAYERNLPVQIFICGGYDEVFNEKKKECSFGPFTAPYKVYPVMKPSSYATKQEFLDSVSETFYKGFQEVFYGKSN